VRMVVREEDRRLMEGMKDLVSSECSHGHVDEETSHLDRMADLPFHREHTSGLWTSPYLMECTTQTVNMASKGLKFGNWDEP
jgi:hypothetical protein